jgi:phosphate starvation-inducible protein PhoH
LNASSSIEIELDRPEFIPEIFGSQDVNIKLIEKKFNTGAVEKVKEYDFRRVYLKI